MVLAPPDKILWVSRFVVGIANDQVVPTASGLAGAVLEAAHLTDSPKISSDVCHQFAAMMIQLVPSDCRTAHLPAVAAKIPVLAAPPASGTTFELALFTA